MKTIYLLQIWLRANSKNISSFNKLLALSTLERKELNTTVNLKEDKDKRC